MQSRNILAALLEVSFSVRYSRVVCFVSYYLEVLASTTDIRLLIDTTVATRRLSKDKLLFLVLFSRVDVIVFT